MCFLLVPLCSNFNASLFVFTSAMAFRGLHHGGVSVNPHDFAPNHTGSVFGKVCKQYNIIIYINLGIFNAFSAITGFVGVYIAGQILQISNNNWSYVFLFAAFQCIFGAIIYSFFGTGKKII